MTRDEREHLNKLSLEIFGTKSKWQKILNHGETVDKMFIIGGKEVKGRTSQYPTVGDIKTVLENRAKELSKEKKVDATVKLPESVSDTSGSESNSQGAERSSES